MSAVMKEKQNESQGEAENQSAKRKAEFISMFAAHGLAQRVTAVREAEEAYEDIIARKTLNDAGKSWVLSAVAVNAGRAMGIGALIKAAEKMWHELQRNG